MKIVSFLCVYNDWEFLDQTIESFKHFPDKLFIIEGSWKSSQKFNANPRSNQQTYDIINKHIDNKKVFLIQANEERERNQRQVGLELAKKEKADWCFMLDSDEVYTANSLKLIKTILQKDLNKDIVGYRLNSYNFINSFKRYYKGNYMRIYRVTEKAMFYMDNDVKWPDKKGIIKTINGPNFYHYNYVKQGNPEAFWLKLNYQEEQDESFGWREKPKYGFDEKTKEYKIPETCTIYDFIGKHPIIMKNHPYIMNNVYNDQNIEFLK